MAAAAAPGSRAFLRDFVLSFSPFSTFSVAVLAIVFGLTVGGKQSRVSRIVQERKLKGNEKELLVKFCFVSPYPGFK